MTRRDVSATIVGLTILAAQARAARDALCPGAARGPFIIY